MQNTHGQPDIDALIARFYAAFDNRNGLNPQLADVAGCFTEKATVVRRSSADTELYTVSEFATPRIALLNQGELLHFHEWEVSSTNQVFGGIAVRTSRYSKAGLLNGKDYSGSGTKCFLLVDLSFGWRIASLAWVDDDA